MSPRVTVVSDWRDGYHREREFKATVVSKDLRLDLAHRSAVTDHTHQELPEAIVDPLDVSEHAHGAHGADRQPWRSMQ